MQESRPKYFQAHLRALFSIMSSEFSDSAMTLVFTDIEGSAELWERFRDDFAQVLDKHNTLMRECAARRGGIEVKNLGDSFLFMWHNADQAVAFAVEAQQKWEAQTWQPPIEQVRVRIGMHTGEAHVAAQANGQNDYFGPAVNRAKRIEAAGHGGQILVSDATQTAATALPAVHREIDFRNLGVHRLRGLGEEHIWQVLHPAIQTEFPPLRTATGPRLHLPTFLTPFMGRAADVEKIKALLLDDAIRLLVLLGPGGVGKTRLSARVAEDVLDAFRDGIWFVELETATSAREFWSRIAYHLEVPIQGDQSEETVVLGYLNGKSILLVLDNVEQIDEAAAVIDLLTRNASGVKCLVSSRERLAVAGANIYEVRPLHVPLRPDRIDWRALAEYESVKFFEARARAHENTFTLSAENARDVGELCCWLEGVPLALELAAAWIPDLSPREILQELHSHLDVLAVESSTVPERQRAMRSSIDWSFTRLAPDEQDALLKLSVCAGGFTRDAAQVLCGLPKLQTTPMLRRLNGKSLLSHSESNGVTRFTMLRTIRRYGDEKLNQTPDAQAAHHDHAQHFLRFAQERLGKLRTNEEVAALREIDADLENLRAALDWSLTNDQHELAAPLALAVGQFMERHGLQKEALRCVQTGMEQIQKWPANEKQTASLLAALWRERASLHLDQFEWPQAGERAADALQLSQQWQDTIGEAAALNLLGLTASRQQHFEEANREFFRALDCYEHLDDNAGRAIVLHNLGLLETLASHPDAARKYFERALQLRRERGDQRGLAETLNNLGVLSQEHEDYESAWQFYLESLDCETRLSDAFGIGRALFNLGEIAEIGSRPNQALRLFAAAERLFEETGSPYRPHAVEALERVALAAGHSAIQLAESQAILCNKAPTEIAFWALQEAHEAAL